jgi:hypothetical protein
LINLIESWFHHDIRAKLGSFIIILLLLLLLFFIKLIKNFIQNILINYLLHIAFNFSKEDANQYQNGTETLRADLKLPRLAFQGKFF